MSTHQKSRAGIFRRLAGTLRGKDNFQAEKERLEAFLQAIPGEYCGWAADGSMTCSKGFGPLLGRENVRHLADIQSTLSPGDAAALEGAWRVLHNDNVSFDLVLQSGCGNKTLRISGTQTQSPDAQNPDKAQSFKTLRIEDITQQSDVKKARLKQQKEKIERLNAALNHLPAAIWLRNDKQEIIWCNETYAEIVKTTPEEIVAQQKEIAPPPKTRQKKSMAETSPGKAQAAKALKESQPQTAQAHVITGGDRLLMNIFEIPVPQHNMTLGVARDITKQEEIESELKRYRAVNKELLQQLRTAISIYNADHSLEFYNATFAALWGLDDGWLNTKPKLGDIMEKLRETRRLPEQADFKKFRNRWMNMFTDLIDPHEDMLHLPDGSALRMLVIPNPMGGMMMTFEDVTSRLALESSYNTLIAVQKETLDNLGEAVAAFGGDGRLKLWNPAFGRLWNLNPEALEGEPHISTIVDKIKPFFGKSKWDTQREDLIALGLDRIMHEGRLERSNDTLVDYVTVPLPDGGVLITYSDVTDTMRVENALREKNAALEAAEKLKLDFLSNVSYQLRTPLNAIMGFNEILDQEYFGPLNKRQKGYTRDVKKASENLLNLINDILDLSTIEAGYMTLNKESIKIKDMLEGLVKLVGDWAQKEKIEIILSCPKTIGTIKADKTRLKQALINLIRNALTYTPEGGKITIQAKRKKTGLEITVSDTGIGISKEDQNRIMEPFERAHSGEQGGGRSGAGLGLSLVKNIITLHGGSIDLLSAPGKGTSITLFLPFAVERREKSNA